MITDDMLRVASEKSCEIYTDFLTENYLPNSEHLFSALFRKRIHKLKKKADHISLYQSLHRVAIILLTILITTSTWLAIDASARSAVWSWIKEMYGTFFVYRYGDDTSFIVNETYRPIWLPDEYTEIYSEDDSDGGQVLYSNNLGQFLQFFYIIQPDESSLFIENTDITIIEVEVNHYDAHYLQSSNEEFSDALMWTNEKGHAFYLSGFEDFQVLVKIAENISALE